MIMFYINDPLRRWNDYLHQEFFLVFLIARVHNCCTVGIEGVIVKQYELNTKTIPVSVYLNYNLMGLLGSIWRLNYYACRTNNGDA